MFWVLLLPLLTSSNIIEKGSILLVDDASLIDTVIDTHAVLIQFSAPWCGQCKKISLEFEKAAAKLKAKDVKTLLIDASVNVHVATAYGVIGYPSIYLVVDQKPVLYLGERKAEEIVKWVTQKISAQTKQLNSSTDIETYKQSHSPLAVLLAAKDSTEAKTFDTVIRPLTGHFAISESQEAAEHYNVTAPKLILLKSNEEGRVDFEGEFSASAVSEFIERNSIPWVLNFTAKTSSQVFYPNSTRLFFFRAESDSEKFSSVVKSLAENLQGKPVIVVADLATDLNARLAELLGVNPHAMPYLMLYEMSGPQVQKFIHSGEKTLSDILAFLDQRTKGDLKPYFKTEDPPEDPVENGIRLLVGKTFPEVALDPAKTVLVNFFAPWCGHSFHLIKEYEKVAAHFKNRDEVVVAKLDASMNEIEGQLITTYPQLKLFRKDNKIELLYDGERKAADIISFVEGHLGKR